MQNVIDTKKFKLSFWVIFQIGRNGKSLNLAMNNFKLDNILLFGAENNLDLTNYRTYGIEQNTKNSILGLNVHDCDQYIKAWYVGENDGGSEKQYAHKNSRNKSKLAFYKLFWHFTVQQTINSIFNSSYSITFNVCFLC